MEYAYAIILPAMTYGVMIHYRYVLPHIILPPHTLRQIHCHATLLIAAATYCYCRHAITIALLPQPLSGHGHVDAGAAREVYDIMPATSFFHISYDIGYAIDCHMMRSAMATPPILRYYDYATAAVGVTLRHLPCWLATMAFHYYYATPLHITYIRHATPPYAYMRYYYATRLHITIISRYADAAPYAIRHGATPLALRRRHAAITPLLILY